MANFKEGEIVTDIKTGKKFRVEGGSLELDPQQYGRIEGKFTSPASAVPKAAAAFNATEEEMTEKEFTQKRQKAAIKNYEQAKPTLRRAAALALPTAAGIVPAMMGAGPLAAGVIGAGGTAYNQLAGLEPNSPMQIFLAGAIPYAAQKGVNLFKEGYKALGKAAVPGVTRTAGVEAGIQKVGGIPNVINRANAPKASKAAYEIAEAQSPLPVDEITNTIESVATKTGKAIPNRPAIRQLRETIKNIKPPVEIPEVPAAPNMAAYVAGKNKAAAQLVENLRKQPTEVSYKEVMNEVNGLRAQAEMAFNKRNSVSGTTLSKAASELLDKMDEISPAIKKANALYRREQSIEKISKVLSNPRPDVKLGELMLQDDLVRGIIPFKDQKFLENVARQIASIGTTASPYAGMGGRFLNLIATPLANAMSNPTGRFLMRQTFKDGKVTAPGLAVVAQFMRAYEASGADEQE